MQVRTKTMLAMFVPWMLWWPITQNPSSTLAVVVSFVPPINSFGMLLRIASAEPPPAWQVWLSIGIGVAGAFGALIVRRVNRRVADRYVVPVSSGFIAGESLMGVVIAMLTVWGVLRR